MSTDHMPTPPPSGGPPTRPNSGSAIEGHPPTPSKPKAPMVPPKPKHMTEKYVPSTSPAPSRSGSDISSSSTPSASPTAAAPTPPKEKHVPVQIIRRAELDTLLNGTESRRVTKKAAAVEEPWKKKKLTDYNLKSVIVVQRRIRRYLAKDAWKRMKKKMAKRTNVAKEMLTTERQYVQNLKILVQAFLTPLRKNASSPNPLITQDDLKAVFSDIEVILGYNSIILNDIENRLKNWDQHTKLGDVFVKMVSFLKTYTQYVNHYRKSLVKLSDLGKNPEFVALMDRIRSDAKEQVGGKGIKDYLIMPVQRIPRYAMLLQDMVRNTWRDHEDYPLLAQAHAKILELAQFVEESQGEAANTEKVLEVQNMLTGKLMENVRLIAPHRKYAREAAATRWDRVKKVERPIHLFLFNDMMIWTKPAQQQQLPGGGAGPKSYEVTKIDSLITLMVKNCEPGTIDTPLIARAFTVVTAEERAEVVLSSKEEKALWLSDIKKFIIESNDKVNNLLKNKKEDGDGDINEAIQGSGLQLGSISSKQVESSSITDKLTSGVSDLLKQTLKTGSSVISDRSSTGSQTNLASAGAAPSTPTQAKASLGASMARTSNPMTPTPVPPQPASSRMSFDEKPRSMTGGGSVSAQPSRPVTSGSSGMAAADAVSPRTAAKRGLMPSASTSALGALWSGPSNAPGSPAGSPVAMSNSPHGSARPSRTEFPSLRRQKNAERELERERKREERRQKKERRRAERNSDERSVSSRREDSDSESSTESRKGATINSSRRPPNAPLPLPPTSASAPAAASALNSAPDDLDAGVFNLAAPTSARSSPASARSDSASTRDVIFPLGSSRGDAPASARGDRGDDQSVSSRKRDKKEKKDKKDKKDKKTGDALTTPRSEAK